MNKILKNLLLYFFVLFILSGCNNKGNIQILDGNIEVGIIGNDSTIDRATVSKMLALANFNKSEIISLDNIIDFKDVENDSWYNKYINATYIKGDMSGVLEDTFEPNGSLTITQTQYLIDKYDKDKKIKIDNDNKDKPISYALWCQIFKEIMEDKDIDEKNIIILGTNSNVDNLKEGYAITDSGLLSFEGLNPDLYMNMKVKVLVKEDEVLAITELIETEPVLKRCAIEKIGSNYVNIFIGGARKSLSYEDMNINDEYLLADIKVQDDKIVNIEYYTNFLRGKVNKITGNSIRINNTNYVLDEDFKVYYKSDDSIHYKTLNDLIIGQDIATYFTKGNENKIYGAIIDTDLNVEDIRVAINDSSYNNLYFSEINLSSKGGLKILVKGEEKYADTLTIKANQDFGIGENEIMIIEAKNEEDGIVFENLKRETSSPTYFGKIEICKTGDKYNVINQVSLEKYVEGVLSSNYNDYTDKEMLRALAVLYRSYAIALIEENNYLDIGANLDDSSKSQIYNNRDYNKIFEDAVNQTKGEIITYDGSAIKGTYFAYSSGVTSNSGEVWANRDTFEYPTENKPYLAYIQDFPETIYEDLSIDINSNIFFKTKDINSMEKDSPWFRWSAIMEEKQLNDINSKIKEIYSNNINFIKTLKNGEYIYSPVETVGNVKNINVVDRGQSGNVMSLEIVGDENTVLIMTDNLIKQVLSINTIMNNNGDTVENLYSLPSTNFVIDRTYDNNGYLKKITFYGGGYGHNVGLSMYGAKKIAEQGGSYQDILSYYYSGIEFMEQ